MREEKVPGIEAAPCGGDLFRWHAQIQGPVGCVYEGGSFEVDIRLPKTYPLEPPALTLRTKIFHPNISERGDICLDLLSDEWSPALSLQKVLLSLSSLLTDPNFADPLNASAAQLMRRDRKSYDKKCREMTRRFAMPAAAASAPRAAKKVAKASPKAKAKSKVTRAPSKPKAKSKVKAMAVAARTRRRRT